MALLLLLRELQTRGELLVDAVAHFNHGIRGAESDEDEEFCRRLAGTLDIAFVSAHADVPALARSARVSIEVAARRARHEFFERVRSARSAGCVATGHTQDDQAETVLLRMTRGTGLRGLGGMPPSRPGLVRPLLTCSRDELRAELRARRQEWREDPTNADLSNPRNRVRHELLPELERHFNPAVRVALTRLANLARTDEDALAREAALVALDALQFKSRETALLDRLRLSTVHPAIARRVVQGALETLTGRNSYSADDIEAVEEVVAGRRRAVELSGVRVEHSGGSVVLVTNKASTCPTPAFRFDLPVPGLVQASDAGWVLEAEGPRPRRTGAVSQSSPDLVEIEAAGLGSLVVRSRLPGDRLNPLGLGGQKKLQDLFVDRKVRRADRDRIPIVTNEFGRIVWVAGHVLEEDFRVTDRTKAVIILKLRRIERLGI